MFDLWSLIEETFAVFRTKKYSLVVGEDIGGGVRFRKITYTQHNTHMCVYEEMNSFA